MSQHPSGAEGDCARPSATRDPDLDWRDGRVPVSRRFQDPYFSLADGLEETRYVYLAGNGLPARFRPGFRVAELGFGTGLTLLALWEAWDASGNPGTLHMTSFEAYPLPSDAMARALAAFPALGPRARALCAQWDAAAGTERHLSLGRVSVSVIVGDARATLPTWTGLADAWFLDGFAPARNPELWEPALMQAVAAHTAPGGTFATYTAAGAVRRALAQAGFAVARQPGHGHKRHMTTGVLA